MTSLDGISVLVGLFVGMPIGMAFLGICLAWDRQPKPRRESMSERHDRLDAEARAANERKQREYDANLAANWRG